jgi:hypothetical protein
MLETYDRVLAFDAVKAECLFGLPAESRRYEVERKHDSLHEIGWRILTLAAVQPRL